MDFNIFRLVKTRDEIDIIIEEIDILIDSLYRTGDADFDHVFKAKLRQETAQFMQTLDPSKEVKKQQLENLKNMLRQAKVLKLTLAFEATSAVAEKISAWLRKNIDPDIVLDTEYDQSLLGGAVIEYQGKYADMSLRQKLADAGL